eukprot:1155115-Pelagomonas_calceolata.AAC.2
MELWSTSSNSGAFRMHTVPDSFELCQRLSIHRLDTLRKPLPLQGCNMLTAVRICEQLTLVQIPVLADRSCFPVRCFQALKELEGIVHCALAPMQWAVCTQGCKGEWK